MRKTPQDKLNQDIDKMIQERWKQVVEETGLANLSSIPIEQMAILRVYFQLGYEQGQADTHILNQEIYNDDPDLFQQMYEADEIN